MCISLRFTHSWPTYGAVTHVRLTVWRKERVECSKTKSLRYPIHLALEYSHAGQPSLPDAQEGLAVGSSKLVEHKSDACDVVVRRADEAKQALDGVLPTDA